MQFPNVLLPVVASLGILSFSSCYHAPSSSGYSGMTPPGHSPPSGGVPGAGLTEQEAGYLFYQAYRTGNRTQALKYATPLAVNKLTWNQGGFTNPTMEYTDGFIYYEGGGINLVFGDRPGGGKQVIDLTFVVD